MEMGNHIKEVPLKIGIDFVIFDGEEFINNNKIDRFFIGSNYFADKYRQTKRNYQYLAGILLDLFAHPTAEFTVEANSHFSAGWLVEDVWREAKILNVESFIWKSGREIQDDHVPLNRVGIPTIDIIDLDYKHWHKLSDTPDKCSAKKMAEVAKVLLSWLQRL